MAPSDAHRSYARLPSHQLLLLLIGAQWLCSASGVYAAAPSSSSPSVTLRGGGSSLAAPLYTSAILAYALQEPSVSLSYASTSSGSGRSALLAGSYDFADSDSILPASFWAAQPDSLCLPVLAAAVVPIFNVPQLSALQLTQVALAMIFMGQVTHWNDSVIADSNVGVDLPYAPISVVVRSDSSGTTHIFTAALAAFYPAFNDSVGSAELVTWPIPAASLFAGSGNTGVANLVASIPYAIGYSVLNEAIYRQLSFASVQNTAGGFVLGSPATVQYALYERAVLALGLSDADILPGPSGNSVSLINPSSPRAYPISGFSYLVVFTNVTRANQTCEARTALVDFMLYFIYSQVVATIASQSEFNSLPQLLQQALNMQQVITLSIRCADGTLAYTAPAAHSSLVSGSGSPSVKSFFAFLTAAYASVDDGASFAYDATTSAHGVLDVIGSGLQPGVASFAVVVDSQLSAGDLQAVQSSESPALQMLPWALLPVVPVFHLPGLTSLVLTVSVIGAMYSGDILEWNDPAIQSLNPNVTLPSTPITLTAVSSLDSSAMDDAPLEATSVFVSSLFRFSPAFSECYANNASSRDRHFEFSASVQPGCSGYASTRWLYAASEGSLQSVVDNAVGAIGFTLTGFTVQAATISISPSAVFNASAVVSFSISQLSACLTDGGYSVSSSNSGVMVTPALSSNPQCWPFVSVVSLLVASAYASSSSQPSAVGGSSSCDQALHLMAFVEYMYAPAASRVLTSAAYSAGLAPIAGQGSPVTTVATDMSAYIASTWTCDADLMVVTPPLPIVWSLASSIRSSGEALSVLGYACTLASMAVVWRRRRQSGFKVASPAFIWLSLLGLLCLFTALLLLVQPVSAGVCSALNWMANLGFTLTLAPLLVKAWRVHRIFNRRKMRVVRITNLRLLLMVAALLTMELALLIAWQSHAPMAPSTLAQQQSNGAGERLYTQCAFSGASLGFFAAAALSKGLMLAAGVLMAFSTRDVAQQFNESKSIAIAIYNIVIILALIAPIIAFIGAVGDTLITLLLFLLTWVAFFTLATLMLPKLLTLLRAHSKVADAQGSLDHTMAPSVERSDMVGGDTGYDFPSLDSLSSRLTLLHYITALEQQHSMAKKKLLSLDKEPQVPNVAAPNASQLVTSTTRPARSRTTLAPTDSQSRVRGVNAAVSAHEATSSPLASSAAAGSERLFRKTTDEEAEQ